MKKANIFLIVIKMWAVYAVVYFVAELCVLLEDNPKNAMEFAIVNSIMLSVYVFRLPSVFFGVAMLFLGLKLLGVSLIYVLPILAVMGLAGYYLACYFIAFAVKSMIGRDWDY